MRHQALMKHVSLRALPCLHIMLDGLHDQRGCHCNIEQLAGEIYRADVRRGDVQYLEDLAQLGEIGLDELVPKAVFACTAYHAVPKADVPYTAEKVRRPLRGLTHSRNQAIVRMMLSSLLPPLPVPESSITLAGEPCNASTAVSKSA